jgi:CDP-4-dehydro-6-deoxyglucose reductase, E3
MPARFHAMQVTIQPLGRTFALAAGETVLAGALRAHLNLPHSCKRGSCGSCRARLISGAIGYPGGTPAALATGVVAADEVLLCQAVPHGDLVVEARDVRQVGEVTTQSLPCRVAALERLAPDVMRVLLRLPAVAAFGFAAGQYLDVMLADGRRRSFSIATPPHDAKRLELHVRRAAGGEFTAFVFDAMTPGTLLSIEGPLGQFAYRDGGGPAILVAGGTGFAPIKAILRHVLERGLTRPLTLYWGARREVDLYEADWVRAMARRYPTLRFVPVLSETAPEAAAGIRTGLVHEAVIADHADLRAAELYAAGPPAMIEALRAALPGRGLAPERLHFDSFDFAPDAARQPAH